MFWAKSSVSRNIPSIRICSSGVCIFFNFPLICKKTDVFFLIDGYKKLTNYWHNENHSVVIRGNGESQVYLPFVTWIYLFLTQVSVLSRHQQITQTHHMHWHCFTRLISSPFFINNPFLQNLAKGIFITFSISMTALINIRIGIR